MQDLREHIVGFVQKYGRLFSSRFVLYGRCDNIWWVRINIWWVRPKYDGLFYKYDAEICTHGPGKNRELPTSEPTSITGDHLHRPWQETLLYMQSLLKLIMCRVGPPTQESLLKLGEPS